MYEKSYKYILISLFLLFSFESSNQTSDYEIIEENKIKCLYGTNTFQINNPKQNKYLILIKSQNIDSYNLYDANFQIITSDNQLYNDIFYYIKYQSNLYLKIYSYNNECFSFKFSETPYLDIKEEQDFTHPIIDSGTIIKFSIKETYKKKITLYLYNINSAVTVNFGSKKYSISWNQNLIKTHNEMNENSLNIQIQIQDSQRNILPIIKYLIENIENKESDNEDNKNSDNNEDNKNSIVLIIVLIIVGVVILLLLFCVFLMCLGSYLGQKEEKKEKAEKMRKSELIKKIKELYPLIKNNYKLIENTCFICVKTENSPLFYEDEHDNNSIDFISSINNENFTTLLEYITPKECPHFFHDQCLRDKNIFYTKKDTKLCLLCKSYITVENMKKFGCIDENDLTIIVNAYNDTEKFGKKDKFYNYFDKINDVFYSEVESSPALRNIKQQKLLRIKKLKNKFKNNFKALRFSNSKYKDYREYDISIYDDLDEVEENLIREIRIKTEKLNKINEKVEREMREEEEMEYLHSLYSLRTCSNCMDKCYFCNQSVPKEKRKYGLRAHIGCMPYNNCCCLCKKGPNIWEVKMCVYCFQNHNISHMKCFSCNRC